MCFKCKTLVLLHTILGNHIEVCHTRRQEEKGNGPAFEICRGQGEKATGHDIMWCSWWTVINYPEAGAALQPSRAFRGRAKKKRVVAKWIINYSMTSRRQEESKYASKWAPLGIWVLAFPIITIVRTENPRLYSPIVGYWLL